MGKNNTIADVWAHVDKRGPDECWPWRGKPDWYGYGRICFNDREWKAHVLIHVLAIGPVPDGMHVDHVCHTRSCTATGRNCPHRMCVNPAHLQAATPRSNTLRSNNRAALNAEKECCPRCGSAYSVNKKGARFCQPCANATSRRYRERKRLRS